MTWYINSGTAAVPGLPVALPVTVERGVVERVLVGAEQAAWQEARERFLAAWAVAPPQPASSAAVRRGANAVAPYFHSAVRNTQSAYRFPRRCSTAGSGEM